MAEEKKTGGMTVREAGRKGGQKVRAGGSRASERS